MNELNLMTGCNVFALVSIFENERKGPANHSRAATQFYLPSHVCWPPCSKFQYFLVKL